MKGIKLREAAILFASSFILTALVLAALHHRSPIQEIEPALFGALGCVTAYLMTDVFSRKKARPQAKL